MATIFGTSRNNTLIVEGDNLQGLAGDDTYIISDSLTNDPANANLTVVISDTEGRNRIQLTDGTRISRADFLGGNAVQFTLANGSRIQVVAADQYTFDIGGNSVVSDSIGLTGQSFLQLANALGVTLNNGSGSKAEPVTVQPGPQPLGPSSAPNLPELRISLTSSPPSEGNNGSSAFIFEVTRLGNTASSSQVNYTVQGSGSNPASVGDFANGVLPSGTVMFAVNQSTATITINVAGDTVVESTETFTVSLSNPIGATLGSVSSATGSIQNDDVAAQTDDYLDTTATTGRLQLGVVNTGRFETTTDVDWLKLDLIAGQQYTITASGPGNPTRILYAPDGSTFLGGVTEFTNDFRSALTVIAPSTGTYYVELASVNSFPFGRSIGNYEVLAELTPTVVSILDAINPTREGNAGSSPFIVTLSRTGDISAASIVNYEISAIATNSDDFTGGQIPNGTVMFNPGQATQNIIINIAGDFKIEEDESFQIVLSNPTGTAIGRGRLNSSIPNDDTEISITSANILVDEQLSSLLIMGGFRVTLSRIGDLSRSSSVSYIVQGISSTNPGTAQANAADFIGSVFPTGTVTFTVGQRTADVTFFGINDSTIENHEQFSFTLINPTGATIGISSSTIGAIINDDFNGDDFLGNEMTSTQLDLGTARHGIIETTFDTDWFRLNLTEGQRYSVSINSDFLGGLSLPEIILRAPNGVDVIGSGVFYNPGSQIFNFIASETGTYFAIASALITNETRLPSFGSYEIKAELAPTAELTPTFIDFDQISEPSTEGSSGTSRYSITLFRGGDVRGVSNVTFTISGNNSSSSADFPEGRFPRGTLTFFPGQNSLTFFIDVLGDTFVESDETFLVTLASTTGDQFSSPQVSLRIVNDDFSSVSIQQNSITLAEGNSGSTPYNFVLTRGGNLTSSATVGFNIQGSGTNPASAADFANGLLPSGMVSFAPNQSTATLTINVAGDTVTESNETFTVNLTNPVGATLGTFSTATGTITNDDVNDDFAATASTTGFLQVGGTARGMIEVPADQDWYAVELNAGTTYTLMLSVDSGSALDSFVRFRSSTGTVLTDSGINNMGLGAELVFTPDESGRYFIDVGSTNGATSGAYSLALMAEIDSSVDESRFNIDVNYSGPVQYRSAFAAAAVRFETIIIGDLPTATYRGQTIDDFAVNVVLRSIDGVGATLSQSRVDAARPGVQPTNIHSTIQFDISDIEFTISNGIINNVVRGPLLTALGFSGSFDDYGLNSTFGRYTGDNALREYRSLRDPNATFIPLETTGPSGVANERWDDNLFFGEIGGAFISPGEPSAISRITIGALQDIGFIVNYLAADPFIFNPSSSLIDDQHISVTSQDFQIAQLIGSPDFNSF